MPACHVDQMPAKVSVIPVAGWGVLGSTGLLSLYFGLLTALQGWSFAAGQFQTFWPYIIALAIGFGLQVALFVALHRTTHDDGSGRVVAATGTTSGLAMVSCCAHYLVSLLPALGASGLVAVVDAYQVQLFWFGLAANLAGIAFIGRRLISARRAVAAVLILALALPFPASAQPLPKLVDKQGQVTVEVTPLSLGAEAWRFQVVFDTHTVALDHDPAAVAVLRTPDGRKLKPLSWVGDPPGSHHRKGVLTFAPLTPAPAAITLVIRDVGPIPERSFHWTLAP